MSNFNSNFYYLLQNTQTTYPIPKDEKEAIQYLEYINQPNFLYNNSHNYDVLDYEKIFFIEIVYGNNQYIQDLLESLKNKIAEAYKIKNQYINRIIDFPQQKIERIVDKQGGKYFGLPR